MLRILTQGLLRQYRGRLIHLKNKIQSAEQTLSNETSKVKQLQSIIDEKKYDQNLEHPQSNDGAKMEEMRNHIEKLDQENVSF